MLDPSIVFGFTNSFGLIAWAALALSLFVATLRTPVWTVTQFVIPGLWAVAYILLLWDGWGQAEGGGFSSIEQVRALFSIDSSLTAGWLHYLAFDLFVGTWIAREAVKAGIPGLLVVPCLILTLLFGPAGLLLFLIIRLAFGRRRQATETA